MLLAVSVQVIKKGLELDTFNGWNVTCKLGYLFIYTNSLVVKVKNNILVLLILGQNKHNI